MSEPDARPAPDPRELAVAAAPPSSEPTSGEQPTTDLFDGDPTATRRDATLAAADRAAQSLSPRQRVIPSWTDPTVRRAAELIGGPLGRHAQVGRLQILTPLRVCFLIVLATLICAWLAKSPCIQQTGGAGGTVVLDSSANRQWISGCYNDVVPAYQIYDLDQAGFPYAAKTGTDGSPVDSLPYPVLIGAFMWLIARITRAYLDFAGGFVDVPLDVAAYLSLGAIALGLIYLWAVSTTLKMTGRRPWDTAIMCASPLLIVHAFTNWDIIPIALLSAAMLAWSRKWLIWAGIFLGLGVAAKLYPILFLIPLIILALRTGKVRPVLTTMGVAVVTWAAVNVPVALAYPDAWAKFFQANVDRGAEFTTMWSIFSTWSGSTVFTPSLAAGQSPSVLNAVTVLLFAIAVIVIGWLGLSAQRRPRLAQLMFLTVAAFLLITKTWNPQFSLWLLPLAVLAVPRWRPVLIWQLAEAATWFLLMLTFATKGDSTNRYALIASYPFQTMALVRDGLLLLLMAIVVRDILRPAMDLVRQTGDDDPTGGVYADAPDAFTIESVRFVLGFGRRMPAGAGVEVEDEGGAEVEAGVDGPPDPETGQTDDLTVERLGEALSDRPAPPR